MSQIKLTLEVTVHNRQPSPGDPRLTRIGGTAALCVDGVTWVDTTVSTVVGPGVTPEEEQRLLEQAGVLALGNWFDRVNTLLEKMESI